MRTSARVFGGSVARLGATLVRSLLVGAALLAPATRLSAASPAPVAAASGMVVSAHRLATEAGLDVLRQGGNAVDAAVAVGYALAVTFPEAGNLGGGGFMTVRMADGTSHFVDFRETAPGAARAQMFLDAAGKVIPQLSTRGYLAAGVPGTVAGLELARERWGTRGRAALMAPAIDLARAGFVLDAGDARFLASGAAEFAKDAPSTAVFLHDGAPFRAGERLVQTDLADSLAAIAKDGASAFYSGPIAAKMVAASRAHGGVFAGVDFAAYKARVMAPLECDYRGYHVISAPPPSSGGVVVCETLGVLAGYDIGAAGFHSAEAMRLEVEALRRAYHDRNVNLGDPAFVKGDPARFFAPGYLAMLREGIGERATPSLSLGGVGAAEEGHNTTHYSIVDAAGNAVSVTYTLNDWFGAHVTVPGTGILLNDEMDDFSAKPGAPNMFGLVEGANNAIRPGARPLSSMTPTIVTRDGKLVLVIGTPGGSQIPTGVLQVMINLIDHGMGLQEAVDAPRFHHQWLPDEVYYEAWGLSADTRRLLEARGYKLVERRTLNQIAAILVGAPKLGGEPIAGLRLYGALDPRLPTGLAAGY
jgi:gamma-glutamyltranspeptidase/glutathione hydrolase